jgi:hypothetical protein
MSRVFLSEQGTGLTGPHSLHGAAIHITFTSRTLACRSASRSVADSFSRAVGGTADHSREDTYMNVTKVLGLAAVGALLILAAPVQRAEALSLANPGTAVAVQDGSTQNTTAVHWHRGHGGWHRGWHRHHRHWR